LLTELVVLRRKLFESEEKRQQLVQRTNLEIQTYQAKITDLKLSLDLLNSSEVGDSDSLEEFYSSDKKIYTPPSPSKVAITESTFTSTTSNSSTSTASNSTISTTAIANTNLISTGST